MTTWIYGVLGNLAASAIAAVWAVGRVKVHLKRHNKMMINHMRAMRGDFSKEVENVGPVAGSNGSGRSRVQSS